MSGEHLLILGIVLLIFGPRRLPELGNTLGRSIRNFKDAISGIEEAKFRKLEENDPKQQAQQASGAQTPQNQRAQPAAVAQQPISPSPSVAPFQTEPVKTAQTSSTV